MQAKRGRYRKSAVSEHGGGYRYRRGVPKDLQALIGRTCWIEWFGTIGRGEAERRALALSARHLTLIDTLRNRLTDNQRREIALAGGIEAWERDVQETIKAMRFVEVGAGDAPSFDPEAPEEVQAQQILDGMKAHRSLEAMRGHVAGAKKLSRKLAGNIGDDGIIALVDLWEKIKAPRNPKSAEKARLYARRFVDVVGDLKPSEITRAHVIKFRDALEAQGKSAENVAAHLDRIHALFNLALGENIVTSNPAHKIKARPANKKHSDGRQGFTSGHVKSIFKALKGETDDFAWTIKLLAYHGMRGGEVCQLRVDDVAVESGMPVLRIHDRHGQVKNKNSVRDIPIHPMCKGIVAFARKVAKKHGADAWLFQSWEAQKQGRAHKFQNYGNREFLRQSVGIEDRCYVLHSFRHRFRTLCREAEMPDSVSRALMGHTLGAGEHGAYGGAPSLKKRSEWIKRINPLKG